MNNDHTAHLAVIISWAGLLAGLLAPVAFLLTAVFTVLNIYIAVRKLRREALAERSKGPSQ